MFIHHECTRVARRARGVDAAGRSDDGAEEPDQSDREGALSNGQTTQCNSKVKIWNNNDPRMTKKNIIPGCISVLYRRNII